MRRREGQKRKWRGVGGQERDTQTDTRGGEKQKRASCGLGRWSVRSRMVGKKVRRVVRKGKRRTVLVDHEFDALALVLFGEVEALATNLPQNALTVAVVLV